MLVALCNGMRFEAKVAEKGLEYHCPKCSQQVIPKKGRIVIHHFAHKPPIACAWGKGETREHLDAKKMFSDEFINRGLRAEVEHEVPSLPGPDRRADVLVWFPNEDRFAIELQHTTVDYQNLEQRTQSYIRENVAVIWIPFLPAKYAKQVERLKPSQEGDFRIEKFSPRPLERWVHGFYYGKPWIYNPNSRKLFRYQLKPYYLYKESAEWFDQDGNYQYEEGGEYPSKRWKELILWGPYCLDQVNFDVLKRSERKMGNHYYPGGRIGKLVLNRSDSSPDPPKPPSSELQAP